MNLVTKLLIQSAHFSSELTSTFSLQVLFLGGLPSNMGESGGSKASMCRCPRFGSFLSTLKKVRLTYFFPNRVLWRPVGWITHCDRIKAVSGSCCPFWFRFFSTMPSFPFFSKPSDLTHTSFFILISITNLLQILSLYSQRFYITARLHSTMKYGEQNLGISSLLGNDTIVPQLSLKGFLLSRSFHYQY